MPDAAATPEISPRVVALIDVPDLERQVTKRAGREQPIDWKLLLERLGAAVAELAYGLPRSRPHLETAYLYGGPGDLSMTGPTRVVLMRRGTDTLKVCRACDRFQSGCLQCRKPTLDTEPMGRDSPIAQDLMVLTREDAFDWVVLVSSDTWLIPLVRFVQGRAKKVIHGCFPPLAEDLSRECWATLDLGPLLA